MMRPASRDRLAALVVVGVAALLSACGDEGEQSAESASRQVETQDGVWERGPDEPSRDRLPCTSGAEPANFTVYSLGPRLADLPLTAVLRTCARPYPGEWVRSNSVSFIYGTCTVEPDPETGYVDGGCAPTVEIQTWPACERTLADLGQEGPEPGERSDLTELRGVPAARDDGRIELYAGDATIVIQANGPALTKRAVSALQAERADLPPFDAATTTTTAGDDLPPPAPGTLRGELSCAG
jgi:hypothetical protein